MASRSSVGRALVLFLCFLSFGIAAAEKSPKSSAKNKQKQSVAQLIQGKAAHTGLLNFYQSQDNGALLLVLEKSQLSRPILYFAHTVNGTPDAGTVKGQYREYKVIEFRRHFDRIEIVAPNLRFYLDPDSPIARSAGSNLSPAVLASLKIKAEDKKTGRMALEIDKVLLSEALHKVSPYPNPSRGAVNKKPKFKLGKLNQAKTRYVALRSYPKNSDVVVEYVFDNPNPVPAAGPEVTDPRTVAIRIQHSFIELPQNNGFKPRRDDPRIGYFTQQRTDLTSDDWAPYRDVINRWHLVKKDPSAPVSEPVEPIVFWIENTTPKEWRETIREAALRWNEAFELAGFKNAIVVKVQPDDADWDAGDLRYNVLRWTASPRPMFGGYGPSLANPLTGQILGADIMLEYVYMKNRALVDELYTEGANAAEIGNETQGLYCSAGHFLHSQLLFAGAVLDASGAPAIEKKKLLKQAMSRLILHEIGHTLGLNHNMRASQLWNATDIHDAAKTKGNVTASVMDYPAINIAPPGFQQGDYVDWRPGPYDKWAIEYGYSPALDDPEAEEARLEKILSRSTEPALAFGNDADDMRAPGRHIDPRVMINDLSNEAIKYGAQRMALIRSILPSLKDKLAKPGKSWQHLLVGFNRLFGEYIYAGVVASRYIGGVYVDRAMVGQAGAAEQPFMAVPLEKQLAAMKLLRDRIFAPDAFDDFLPLVPYLQRQRRGFSDFGKNINPKFEQAVYAAQAAILAHVLHPEVLARLSESRLYGNEYTVNRMLSDLTAAIFDADKKTSVSPMRQRLQLMYVKRLVSLAGLGQKPVNLDPVAQTAAYQQLLALKDIGRYQIDEPATRAHRALIRQIISTAMKKL
ncbi:MAG: DUF5117 domain-containing protein [Gammaproteobacteria bacterium]|nr:MAG: DUF5117 domain-containing protein [Gammaproteobacteria bacterium]